MKIAAGFDEQQTARELRSRYLDNIEEYINRMRTAFESNDDEEYRLLKSELNSLITEFNKISDREKQMEI